MNEKTVVLIVGAGAVENAWLPIYKSFQNVFSSSINNADSANFQFTRLVYLLRFYSASKFAETTKDALEYTKKKVVELKHEIVKQLSVAQQNQELKIRTHFETLLMNFIFKDEIKFAVISTNWDTIVNQAINNFAYKIGYENQINIFHLHGSIGSPNSLYLPSEITCENYRTVAEDKEHGINQATLLTILKKANQIILYGISLDPLDAELNQTIFESLQNDDLQEVIVINPDYKKVSNRVKLLLEESNKNIKISCYNPLRYDAPR
jgi:hypothetical protein